MFVSEALGLNEKGHLTIGGKDTVELAEKYGTPLYVMDENEIRRACRRYLHSMEENYGGHGMVAYASKAFCCKEMCRIAGEEGLGLDVVSGGEIYTALSAGFPAERLIFHGNNKTHAELALALEKGVGRIVTDNLTELRTLNQMAGAAGRKQGIMLRIKPGIDAHTHDFVRTGQIDSNFGFALATGEAFEAVKEALADEHLTLLGLDNDPVPYEAYMNRVSQVLAARCRQEGIEMPFVIIEPGRSIAAPAGITLYTVGGIKHIPNIRTYVSVDGGMGANPRYALYRAAYTVIPANKAAHQAGRGVTVAGKCCESGDLLGENVTLQEPVPGDILAVLATGAYNYSMASNYNRNPRPAVVMIRDGQDRVVIRAESYEDLIRGDV